MKILVVCQHYYPEDFRVTEICEELVRRGHEVTALVGLPNYPSGHVPGEYRFFRRRRETINGVIVRRCFEIGRRNTKPGLAVNYLSYMISACWKAIWLDRDYDVIYAYSTSPVLMSAPAALLRRLTRIPMIIYVLDIWPACLAAMNVPPQSALYRVMKRVSRRIYARADCLIYSSSRFRGYLKNTHGLAVPEDHYLPQFADDMFEQALPMPEHEGVTLCFAGNIGKAQGVSTLLRAAALLREEPVRWAFLGDGSDYENCLSLVRELHLQDCVAFYGRKPVSEMPAWYAQADAMLVSMTDDPLVSQTLPGKVQSYLACGRPILGSIAGEAADVIAAAHCGYCASPGDAPAFADAVRRFLNTPDRVALAQNARAYYEARFTKQKHMDRLEKLLAELKERHA